MKKEWLLIAAVIISRNISHAQDTTVYLALPEAVATATANNDAVKIASLDEQIAKARHKETSAIFLPRVTLDYTALATDNPLNAFGFKLQQQSITAADFDPARLNNPSATYDVNARLAIQQPVINLDLVYQRKAAAMQVEMYGLMSVRTREALAFETEKAYLNLQMIYRTEKVLQQTLLTSRGVEKITSDYYEQGLVQKSDWLNAQVFVSMIESRQRKLQTSKADASDWLSLLMNKPAGTIYRTDSISRANSLSPDSAQLSMQRADLAAIQKAVASYDLMITSSRKSYYPRLNAFASWQYNDRQLTGFNAGSYLAGLQLSWNLFNGNRTRSVINRQQLEKDKLVQQLEEKVSADQLQIRHVKGAMSDALSEMKTRELGSRQADEALRVLQNRYKQGLVKTTEILQAQQQLAEQQLAFVQAIYDYNVALATLIFLTKN